MNGRQLELTKLILLGKERGYLTFSEITEHLPDDVQGGGQIDGIIAFINNMGIDLRQELAKIYTFKRPV